MYRERLTITLDSDLLEAVDSTIDRSKIRNRSHAIEHLLREGLALHQLHQVFLLLDESADSSLLPKVITVCDKLGIDEYFLVPTPETSSLLPEFSASIQQLSSLQPTVQTVAGDFGSGGALILQKPVLTTAFLIISFDASLSVPRDLTAAYSFHRQHNGLVTQLLTSGNAREYEATGMAIANPELLNEIPAGAASLQETIFPALLKEGKVKGYVTS